MKRAIALAAGLGLAFVAGHMIGTVQTIKHLSLTEFMAAKADLGVEIDFTELPIQP